MRYITILVLIFSIHMNSIAQSMITGFEKNNNTTATYYEAIRFYEMLAQSSPKIKLLEYGSTDSGYPVHLAVWSANSVFNPAKIKESGKLILMVNNAIHAGEPCGVDATMMLFRDLAEQKEKQTWMENTVLIAIPVYNIGGALNRNSHTRTNQNGPESYGFRGNARNLDLNRDFIKCDSRNAGTFNQLFTEWQPDVFIDNHTSNGADYQYTMTMIASQHNKLDTNFSDYLNQQMMPHLYKTMKFRKWEMTPYVFVRDTPDKGIAAFLDLPRYSSGYAALFNCLSFIGEAHMLKPYKDRVYSTLTFMETMLEFMHDQHTQIKTVRKKAQEHTQTKKQFDLNWQLDMEQASTTLFKGYEAGYKPSKISGKDRLYYDRSKPYEKEIPFFNNYKTTLSVEKPDAYIIPQAYQEIIQRLQWNGVQLQQLNKDQTIAVEMYRIKDYKSANTPYEGHYLHREVEVEKEPQTWLYRKGDYVVFTNQITNRYIIETLEPQAPDSFFAWNFFDGILMQKEYFSSYVFEDLAADYLDKNPDLQKALDTKKKEDSEFAKSAQAQLAFVYKHSPHYEPTHNLYPVGRVVKIKTLEVE